jgi:rubrerythrin
VAEKQATESYKIMPRGTLSGQVFVASKGGENFKLGALQVSLFARDAIDILLAALKVFRDAKIEQLPVSAAATAEEQAEAAVEQAKAKEKIDWEYYQQSLSSNAARHAAKAAEEAAAAASEHYRQLLRRKDFYYSANFYFSHLQSPIQTAETDGDGKFDGNSADRGVCDRCQRRTQSFRKRDGAISLASASIARRSARAR